MGKNYLAGTLDRGQVTDVGLLHVKRLPKLERLTISGRPLPDSALNVLTTFPNLKYVYLEKNGASETGLKRLKAARPDLIVLDH